MCGQWQPRSRRGRSSDASGRHCWFIVKGYSLEFTAARWWVGWIHTQKVLQELKAYTRPTPTQKVRHKCGYKSPTGVNSTQSVRAIATSRVHSLQDATPTVTYLHNRTAADSDAGGASCGDGCAAGVGGGAVCCWCGITGCCNAWSSHLWRFLPVDSISQRQRRIICFLHPVVILVNSIYMYVSWLSYYEDLAFLNKGARYTLGNTPLLLLCLREIYKWDS